MTWSSLQTQQLSFGISRLSC